jgi:transcription antitermination factor NusA-like protein
MVGYKGERISEILSLLDWEKIDFIEIDQDPEVFLRDLLKPAQIQSIEFSDKKAVIKVEEDQKPVAIWKKASNIKLASQIMWMTLEIV